MSASLGATTYTSVNWTSGDVLTEAKLDNMVANDQAYDSHASQGVLVNNNKSLASKDAGGTSVNVARVNTSDYLEVGDENIDGLRLLSGLEAPQGFLLNGKIAPSVASSNLTVAIKTLDGSDPSALNPVFCRIGDTIRKITSALSVTKNAGTNWFNAGGAELATKEIDYFVYLGYNATDGVVIGFSRIPYATEYDDFSATTTNERYCAISTITSAASGDDYENIGRFAATLSAGAGYTWTLPTFTNKNLIQRPITSTRVLNFVSVHTALAPMTKDSTEGAGGKYQINGNIMNIISFYTYGDHGGTATTTIYGTLPMTYLTDPVQAEGHGAEFSYTTSIVVLIETSSGNQVMLRKPSGATWSLASTVGVLNSSFFYRV